MADITQVETRLNAEGLAFLRAALLSEAAITIASHHIGDSYGFFPDPNASEASGTVVYVGNASQTSNAFDSDGNVVFSISLDETVGDFTIGNIMVFAAYTNTVDASLVPLWQTSLPTTFEKLRTAGADAGNTVVIRTTVNIEDGSAITSVNVYATNELYGIIPSVATEANLPTPGPSVNPQFVVQELGNTGAPGLAAIKTSTNQWYANGFFQRLDDHRLGWAFGGLFGDAYRIKSVSTIFGGFFETASGKFTSVIDGGANWAS